MYKIDHYFKSAERASTQNLNIEFDYRYVRV